MASADSEFLGALADHGVSRCDFLCFCGTMAAVPGPRETNPAPRL